MIPEFRGIYIALDALTILCVGIATVVLSIFFNLKRMQRSIDDIGGQLGKEMELLNPYEPKVTEEPPPPPADESLFTPAAGARFNTDSYLAAAAGVDLDDADKRG